jgi:hypothetical protein
MSISFTFVHTIRLRLVGSEPGNAEACTKPPLALWEYTQIHPKKQCPIEIPYDTTHGLHAVSVRNDDGSEAVDTVLLHDLYLHRIKRNPLENSGNYREGFYVGSTYYNTATVATMPGIEIYNNLVEDPGWDGIQVGSASGGCRIFNNTVIRDSRERLYSQHSGIIFAHLLLQKPQHRPPRYHLHPARRRPPQIPTPDITPTPSPNLPPVCTDAGASIEFGWEEKQLVVKVQVIGVTDPDGDPVKITIDGIFHNGLAATAGEDSFTADASGVGTTVAELRTEPAGVGIDWGLRITFNATDPYGGSCQGEVRVEVHFDLDRAGAPASSGAPVEGGASLASPTPTP